MLFERSLTAVNDVKDWDDFIENFPTQAHCPRVIAMLLPRLEGMLGTFVRSFSNSGYWKDYAFINVYEKTRRRRGRGSCRAASP
jgi:hypothetical protein